jgi:hypothetical protein
VDAPGFNDFKASGSKSDLKVLQMIGAFLKQEYVLEPLFFLVNPNPTHIM